jgi:flagellar hook-length control protein FliK
VKGGERMRVGYISSVPAKNAAVYQAGENKTQKIAEKNTFQQLLSQEQATDSNTMIDFNKEKKTTEVLGKTEEKLSKSGANNELELTFNEANLIEWLINSLPPDVAKNISEKLDTQKIEKLFDMKDIVKNIREKLDSSLPPLLADEFQVDHVGQDSMFMSLVSFQQEASSAINDEILTKFKNELENILYNVSEPSEEAISEGSSVQPFVLKPTKNRTTLQNVKENDGLAFVRSAQWKKPLMVEGSVETKNTLVTLNQKKPFMYPLTDQLQRANVVSPENMTIKDDGSNMIFTDSSTMSSSFQQAGAPVISLNETASKSTVNQQFVQQLLEVMKGSKFTKLANGQSQLIVRLNPEHLGTLTIKLVQENGELMAKIIASSTSAKELIEANIQQIRHAIPAQNITIEKFDVFTQQQTYEPSYREQQGRARDEQHSHQEQHRSSKHTNELDFKDAFTNELVNFEV